MRRIFLAFSLLLCAAAANAQSPDGSIILPYNLNSVGSIGKLPNAVSTSFGVVTLDAGQLSPSGDYSALINGNYTAGGGREIAVLNGGALYTITADGNWFQYTGSWGAVSAPVTPDQTIITQASGLPLVSPIGVWGFGKDSLTGGNEVQLNGLAQGLAATTLENLSGSVYAKDTNSQWWQQAGWTKTADPNSYAVPQTITSAFLAANFHSTFSDSFASGLPTIAPNGTYGSQYNWYNGTEQCCMSPTPQPGNVGGAMFPTVVGLNGPYNPYSNNPAGGLTMTMHTETATDSTHTYTSVFSGVTTSTASNGQGFTQQYGYFEATMQFSPNVGTWPAFWMLSPSRNMEIDVTEYYRGNGHNVGHYFATFHDYANGILFGPNEVGGTTDLSTGFHTYGVLIDAGHISFYLDRQLMASSATPPNAKQPMFMLFDQGSGGGWPTCAGPSQVGVNPPPSGTSCSQGSAQLEGALLQIQSINVWQHN